MANAITNKIQNMYSQKSVSFNLAIIGKIHFFKEKKEEFYHIFDIIKHYVTGGLF